jgi:hypothetical protein
MHNLTTPTETTFLNSSGGLLEHDDSWRENLVGNKHKCEPMCGVNLKKFLSPTLDRSPRVIVFISRKVTLWFGPQGVPSFVRRRSTHTMSNITRARRRAWAW